VTIGADRLEMNSCFDVTHGDLKVLHCGNTACRSGYNIYLPLTLKNF
jgi:hypothetical protein